MYLEYDPEADALYFELQPGDVDSTREIASHLFVDVDKQGVPLGIEILNVSHLLAEKKPFSINLETIKPHLHLVPS